MAEIDLSKSVLGFVPCIELQWGTANVRRYCRAAADHVFDGETYTAVPALDIEYQMQDGGTKAKPILLSVPIDLDPFDKLISQTFAPIEVTLLEADFADPSAVPRTAFVGQLYKTIAHYQGKSQLVRMEVFGHRFFLTDVSLGIKCTDRCPWFFGDHVCGATVANTDSEVESITGTELICTSLANDVAGAGGNGYYTRGYVEFDGLRIMVRKHYPGDRKLVMAKAPPQISGHTWVGETVTVYAGCDKTIASCTGWGRQARFGGYGLQMPPYNPLIQDPG